MIPREDVASDPAPAEGEFDLAKFEREFWEEYEESKRKSRPATDLGIYCDQHLGTEMVRSRSHGLAGEYDYGEPKADVWVTDYWRCQQNGCVRCYDASRGYFAFSRIMGSRIQLDTPGQKRCGKHPERPVMYVGKDGNGRRIFCPFYKCGERGEMIAEIVVETPVEVPHAEPKASNQEMQWAEERSVFESFVTAAGLVINEGSIQCGQPPQPDIRCVCSGELRWFELSQIVNEEVKKATDPKRSRGHGISFSQAAPFVRLLDPILVT